MFHERKIGVPPDCHERNIQHLELGWHACEVNELEKRPYLHVGFEGWHQFLRKFILSFLKSLSFNLAGEDEEARDGHHRKECLSEQKLLSDTTGAISRSVRWNQLRVGIVESWSI